MYLILSTIFGKWYFNSCSFMLLINKTYQLISEVYSWIIKVRGEENHAKKKIMLTSGFDFEGYEIVEYLGFMSNEFALGTGFLSEFGAAFADLVGTNSNMFSNKLEEAKDQALAGLIEKAKAVEANAIIGVDIDYNMFSGNIIGVIANGTIVKIRKIPQKQTPFLSLHVLL